MWISDLNTKHTTCLEKPDIFLHLSEFMREEIRFSFFECSKPRLSVDVKSSQFQSAKIQQMLRPASIGSDTNFTLLFVCINKQTYHLQTSAKSQRAPTKLMMM